MNRGALEVVSGFVTAPSTTFTTITNCTGNTTVVRNTDRMPLLLDYWGLWQGTAGILKIVSPNLHDNVNGIYVRPKGAQATRLGGQFAQPLVPQDTLTVQIQGSATGGDIEMASLQIFYPNLPGVKAVMITPAELSRYGQKELTTENTVSSGTAGDYSGAEAVNAEQDQFKANRWYALLGCENQVTISSCTLRYVGPDFGNLGVGVPGEALYNKGGNANYFVELSFRYGLPLIPCMNAANKGATTIATLTDENGLDPIVSTNWVLLSETFNPDTLT